MKEVVIKVVGVGGSGGNAVTRMKKRKLANIELIAINTDAQDLSEVAADRKIRIGKRITRGLGAGMRPEVGRKAALEQKEEIEQALKGADIVFITTGLGGGTGSGAAPVVAGIAKEMGALTIGVITTPFAFEGKVRSEVAEKAKKKLGEKTDTLIVIPNNNLTRGLDGESSLANAFSECDEILRQAVKGISDLVMLPGIVNVNLADIRSVMENSGTAFFGIGKSRGKRRAAKAARRALSSPLLDVSISEANGILFNISGGEDISLYEINEAAEVITKNGGRETRVIFGAIQDEKLKQGTIKVTVIATGF